MSLILLEIFRELVEPDAASPFGKGSTAARRWISEAKALGEKFRKSAPPAELLPSVPVGLLLNPLGERSFKSLHIAPDSNRSPTFVGLRRGGFETRPIGMRTAKGGFETRPYPSPSQGSGRENSSLAAWVNPSPPAQPSPSEGEGARLERCYSNFRYLVNGYPDRSEAEAYQRGKLPPGSRRMENTPKNMKGNKWRFENDPVSIDRVSQLRETSPRPLSIAAILQRYEGAHSKTLPMIQEATLLLNGQLPKIESGIRSKRGSVIPFPIIREGERHGKGSGSVHITSSRILTAPSGGAQPARDFIRHLSEKGAQKLTLWSGVGDGVIPAIKFDPFEVNPSIPQEWRIIAASASREKAFGGIFHNARKIPVEGGMAEDLPDGGGGNPFTTLVDTADVAGRGEIVAEPASGDKGKIFSKGGEAPEAGKGLLATAVEAALEKQSVEFAPKDGAQSDLILNSLQGIASGVSSIEGRLAAASIPEKQSAARVEVRWLEDEDLAGQLQKILRRQAIRKGIEIP